MFHKETHIVIDRHFLKTMFIGKFARLLPSLDVVAVSQAPSPESNPDSPLPVKATVVHCTTVKADRSEVHAIKHACRSRLVSCQCNVPEEQPVSPTQHCHSMALVFQ